MNRRSILQFLTAAAACGPVFAQNSAPGPIPKGQAKLIVPFSAGTGPDVLARSVAQELSTRWNDQVVVLNRAGGNGLLAIDTFKSTSKDGHTLIVLDSSILTVNPHLYTRTNYQPFSDFVPLAALANTPFNLIVSAKLPVRNLKELLDYAKKHPGELSYGSPSGIGHPGHLGMEEFKKRTGTDMHFIPYPASAPMLSDMSTGRLHLAWASLASSKAFVANGSVRILATGARRRQEGIPDVPTVEEAGGPSNFVVNSWLALYGSPSLSAASVSRISADVDAVMRSPAMQEKLRNMSYEELQGDGKAVTGWLRDDSRRFAPLIKELNLKLD